MNLSNYKIVVTLMDGTEEAYEAVYPQTSLELDTTPQGYKVIQRVHDYTENHYVKSTSTVHYPVHRVMRITHSRW